MDLKTHFPSFEGNPKSKRDVQKFIINTFTEKASAPGSSLVSPDSLQEEEEEDEILLHDLICGDSGLPDDDDEKPVNISVDHFFVSLKKDPEWVTAIGWAKLAFRRFSKR